MASLQIFVTTIEKASTKTMSDLKFQRVIFDDAHLVNEADTILSAIHAK